jgi:hypothetical protein
LRASSNVKGLARNVKAPACSESTTWSELEKPDISTVTTLGSISRASGRNSTPVMPGRRMSITTTLGFAERTSSRPRSASDAMITLKPADVSTRRSASTMTGSSSITRIFSEYTALMQPPG